VTYPSRILGKIHFLILAIFLLISVCMLFNQLVYDLDAGFYYEYMSSFDEVILTYQNDILIIAIVTFIVWLLRVHSALRRIEPRYPINEVEYLLRMVLPLVQIWGIASTFNYMSEYFASNPTIATKALRIKIIVVFVYVFYLGTFSLWIAIDEGWTGMLASYVSLVGFVAMYALFLIATYWINQYLHICVQAGPMPTLSSAPTLHSAQTFNTWRASTPELMTERIQSPTIQANIGARLAAKVIEYIIFIILTIAAIVPGIMIDNSGLIISLVSITWVSWFIYLSIHLTMNGQTIGKWLLRLKIVRADTGDEGGFVHNVLLRMVTNNVIGLIVPFYTWVDILFIFSKDARCIHDQLASTRVIKLRDNNKV
jgi:uncharacterized RDD family membrane protein YckC